MAAIVQRFFAKVDITPGCWEWTAARLKFGYGVFTVRPKLVKAHRFSWVHHFGEIPQGMQVLHRCDNPPCVNPDHLFLGSGADNMLDKAAKGRCNTPKGERQSRFSDSDILELRRKAANGVPQNLLVLEYGLSKAQVSRIINRQRWEHLP